MVSAGNLSSLLGEKVTSLQCDGHDGDGARNPVVGPCSHARGWERLVRLTPWKGATGPSKAGPRPGARYAQGAVYRAVRNKTALPLALLPSVKVIV